MVAVVVAVLVVVVVEKKRWKVDYMWFLCLLDPLETVLIQLAKTAVEMPINHRHCTHSHDEKFETLEVATAATVAVVVVAVKAVVDVSRGADLVFYVHFLQLQA